jgi:type IV pilus assembly protein PilF
MRQIAAMIAALALLPFGLTACQSEKNIEAGELHYQIASDLLEKGDQPRAIAELLKAVEADPRNPSVHNLLGLVYAEKGIYDKAEFHLKEAIRLAPPNAESQNNICSVYLKENKPDLAIPACQAALNEITYPTPERAYNNLGYAFQLKGDKAQAMKNYRQALMHNKDFFLTHLNIGKLLFEQGKFNESADSFRAAQKGCDTCVEPPYRLGLSLMKMRKPRAAVEAFRRCGELDKDGAIGRECRQYAQVVR